MRHRFWPHTQCETGSIFRLMEGFCSSTGNESLEKVKRFVALIIGHPAICGILVGTYAMLGDLTSSFLKRRMKLPSSSRVAVLDHVPEALFPTMLLAPAIGLVTGGIIAVAVAFMLIAVVLSPLLYNAGLRKQPY